MILGLPKVIGHRGAPKQAPENTMAGFARAASLGVTWVELDVQLSSDLVPVVFHDEELDRTSDGQGRLVERDFTYLGALDAGSWFSKQFAGERLPSWEAVLDQLIALNLGVNIEIKAEDDRAAITAEKGLELALAKWPVDRPPPLVTSFSREAVIAAKRVAPHWPRGWVTETWQEDWRDFCAAQECVSIHLPVSQMTIDRIATAKQAGLAVLAYVVDDPALAHQLWNWGVDSVFSDRPDQLLG